MTVNPDSNRGPTALRVRQLRIAAGYDTARGFANALGISEQRLNNVENGRPLSLDMARLIKRTLPGITLDWLYDGDAGHLTLEWALRLHASGKASYERLDPKSLAKTGAE